MSNVKSTLEERKQTHGNFIDQSLISQQLKQTFWEHKSQANHPAYIVEAVDMILHKLARLSSGNIKYIDTWRDIIGYSQLVLNELKNDNEALDCEIVYKSN